MNVEKYIEIPFLDHGRDFTGCDCYGLVKLVLLEEFDKVLPDFFAYNDSDDLEAIGELVNLNTPLVTNKRKEIPDEGDIALFTFKGVVTHIGVYIGGDMVLHIMRNTNATCERYKTGRLKGRLEGF